jgi:DNA-binding NarL/FixJ family response regulator
MKYGCVIIADMHHGILDGIRSLLDPLFQTIVMVASKESLFEATKKLAPDIVIVDLSMPSPKTPSFIKEFTSSFPSEKLIVMSVHDDPHVVDVIVSSGVSGFVLKRTAANDLIPAIQNILDGDTYISPSIRYTAGVPKEKSSLTETQKTTEKTP